MLNHTFKHHAWFLGEHMTMKQFLDYVLSVPGDFIIKVKTRADANDLFATPKEEYFLSDRRYTLKLGYQERNYLSEHSTYFQSKLPTFQEHYLNVIIAANNEPLCFDGDLVAFSK